MAVANRFDVGDDSRLDPSRQLKAINRIEKQVAFAEIITNELHI